MNSKSVLRRRWIIENRIEFCSTPVEYLTTREDALKRWQAARNYPSSPVVVPADGGGGFKTVPA